MPYITLTWLRSCVCAGIDFEVLEDGVGVVDLNDTPEYLLVFGPVYVGGALLVTNPVLMGSVVSLGREVDCCEICCSDVSRGGAGRWNADFGVIR